MSGAAGRLWLISRFAPVWLLFSCVPAIAAAVSVSLNPPQTNLTGVGQKVTLTVDISDANGVDSGAFHFQYEPAILSVFQIEYPMIQACGPQANSLSGSLAVAFACVSPLSGSGTLFRITFESLAPGASTINFVATPTIPGGCELDEGDPTCEPVGSLIIVFAPSRTPTVTRTGTVTSTPTATATRTTTGTFTATGTRTSTPSVTRTPTFGNSPTGTATQSPSLTPILSATRTASRTPTHTATTAPTATSTPSPSVSPTWTASPTVTNSRTATRTGSPTSSRTASPTPTGTPSATETGGTPPPATATLTSSPRASATPTGSPTGTPVPCPGDCDEDGTVSIDEIVAAVDIAQAVAPPSNCAAADTNSNGIVTIDELLSAVASALDGCPVR